MRVVRAIGAAFSYFSILPIPSFSAAPDGAAIGWLPLVGLVIGAASGYAAALTFSIANAPLWSIAVALFASIVLSGAIHLDGLLDCSDALVMTAPPHKRLDVLHDPRHGTYAVVAMALVTVAWLIALAHIPPMQMPLTLALVAGIARAAVVSLAQQYRHARTGLRQDGTLFYGVAWFVAFGVLLAVLTHGWKMLGVLAGAFLLAQALAFVASRKLGGGLTGDVYGAIVVIVEIALLTAVPFVSG